MVLLVGMLKNISKPKLLTALFLGLILIFALFVRVYKLSEVPYGFHIDEASLGYNGYSLLLTGKDDNNHPFPLYVDMFGDNRPSGYHYLTILPIKIFGLNEFSTRLPGAFFGFITVIAAFILSFVLFKNKKVSLLFSGFIAFAPWQVVLSRASAETVVALFFIILGFALFIFGLKEQKIKYLVLGVLVSALSFFFYHSPRVFVPLLFLSAISYLYPLWNKFKIKQKVSLVILFFALCLVSFSLVFIIKGGTGRFSQVNIFGDPGISLRMQEQIREDGVMGTAVEVTRFFHNKVINYSLSFISNYSDYFSGKFLFLEGGLPNWYKVPAMGLIYLIELPFFIIGIFYLLLSKDKYQKLPLIWLLVAPITASITVDDIPNLQRAIVMFPMIELISAYGLVVFLNKFSAIKYKIVITVISIIFCLNFAYFLHQYFIHQPIDKDWYRNVGFDKMVKYVESNYKTYDKVFVTKSFGGIYPIILFYMHYDPAKYQQEGSTKDKEGTGFGKFYFVSGGCPSVDLDPGAPKVNRAIYIDNGTCKYYKGLKYKKYFYVSRKDGSKVFRVVYD
jgi:4-amino-4-deoxy-L-arabinose transferase-like glycosyltransferase